MSDYFRVCTTCKKPIAFEAVYQACSVSTCNRKRGGYFFCSVACWDAHVPVLNHRNAWAVERRAPTREEHMKSGASSPSPKRRSSGGGGAPRVRASSPSRSRTPSSVTPMVRRSTGTTSALPKAPTPAPTPTPTPTPAPSPVIEAPEEPEEPPVPNARRNLVVISRLSRHLHALGAKADPSIFEALSEHLRELTELAAMAAEEEEREVVNGADVATALEAYKN